MGGLLTHLSIASFGFLIGTLMFKNWKYGVAFFIGSLIPDLIDFGTIGLFSWEFNPSIIMLSPYFPFLVKLGHTWWHWIVFGLIVFVILILLYKFKNMSEKKFKVWIITELFFLAGVYGHLLIDKLVQETSYWI
jgi:hypothetical protein